MAHSLLPFGNNVIQAEDPLQGMVTPPASAENDTATSWTRPSWETLLGSIIESEILPRLISAQRADLDEPDTGRGENFPSDTDVAAFVALIIADDLEAIRMFADRVIVQCGGRDALLRDLLTPASRLLGTMWERDVCDFMTVTLGVYRLDQIMKETATVGPWFPVLSHHDHRILLLPTPGEQHSFGLNMIADAFREGGWCVRSGPEVSRAKLLQLVRGEWFDVVGLSVTADRALRGLPACIRAIRLASCNPNVYVMVGGRAIVNHAERSRFLGADATASDGPEALAAANLIFERTMTTDVGQSRIRVAEIG